MRLIRMLIVVQIIGILVDSSSITLSAVFKISCRGLLFYSIPGLSLILFTLSSISLQPSQNISTARSRTHLPKAQVTLYRTADVSRTDLLVSCLIDLYHLINYNIFLENRNNTSSSTILPTRSLEYITVKQYSKAPLSHPFIIDFLDPSNYACSIYFM